MLHYWYFTYPETACLSFTLVRREKVHIEGSSVKVATESWVFTFTSLSWHAVLTYLPYVFVYFYRRHTIPPYDD